MGTMLHNIGLHISFHDLWQVAVHSGGNRCWKSTVDGQFGKPWFSVYSNSIRELMPESLKYENRITLLFRWFVPFCGRPVRVRILFWYTDLVYDDSSCLHNNLSTCSSCCWTCCSWPWWWALHMQVPESRRSGHKPLSTPMYSRDLAIAMVHTDSVTYRCCTTFTWKKANQFICHRVGSFVPSHSPHLHTEPKATGVLFLISWFMGLFA